MMVVLKMPSQGTRPYTPDQLLCLQGRIRPVGWRAIQGCWAGRTHLSAVWGRDQAMMLHCCLSSASQGWRRRLEEVAQLQTPNLPGWSGWRGRGCGSEGEGHLLVGVLELPGHGAVTEVDPGECGVALVLLESYWSPGPRGCTWCWGGPSSRPPRRWAPG